MDSHKVEMLGSMGRNSQNSSVAGRHTSADCSVARIDDGFEGHGHSCRRQNTGFELRSCEPNY